MSDIRYVVEFFAENSDEMSTLFVEADTKELAKQTVVDRFGAFVHIVACNLTKSCGGPGAKFQPDTPVQFANDVIELDEESKEQLRSASVWPERIVETPKKTKEPKTAKVTNASRIREQVILAKAANQSEQTVVDWAVANLGQTKGMAKAYTKAIWAE